MATLRQLKTFIAVAECGKMHEAARRLSVSRPTVCQIISELEEEYQAPLFERLPREMRITLAGRVLLNNAQELVSLHEHLEQSMKNIHAHRLLRIGATLTIGNTMMGSIIERLQTQYPDIDVNVFVDNTRLLEHRLLHNELDIALVEGVITQSTIVTRPVLEDSMCLICGADHPFASRKSVAIEELKDRYFIMREKGSGTRAIFENIMLTHRIPFFAKWECSSSTAILEAVRHNLGLGVLSERCILAAVERGEICAVPVEDVSMKRYFYICHNKNHLVNSQMKDFEKVVEECR